LKRQIDKCTYRERERWTEREKVKKRARRARNKKQHT